MVVGGSRRAARAACEADRHGFGSSLARRGSRSHVRGKSARSKSSRAARAVREANRGSNRGSKLPRAARAHSEAARDEATVCQLGKSVNSFPYGEWFFGMALLCARRGQDMRAMRRTACGEAASGSVGDGEAGRDLVAGDPPQ